MTQPTFDFSTLFDTYKTAMAPVFRAQQEGLKTLERLAHYQFAVAGDYLDWSLSQAKASVGPKSAADMVGAQTALNTQFGEKLRARLAQGQLTVEVHSTTPHPLNLGDHEGSDRF